jgi:hypothetical protein
VSEIEKCYDTSQPGVFWNIFPVWKAEVTNQKTEYNIQPILALFDENELFQLVQSLECWPVTT